MRYRCRAVSSGSLFLSCPTERAARYCHYTRPDRRQRHRQNAKCPRRRTSGEWGSGDAGEAAATTAPTGEIAREIACEVVGQRTFVITRAGLRRSAGDRPMITGRVSRNPTGRWALRSGGVDRPADRSGERGRVGAMMGCYAKGCDNVSGQPLGQPLMASPPRGRRVSGLGPFGRGPAAQPSALHRAVEGLGASDPLYRPWRNCSRPSPQPSARPWARPWGASRPRTRCERRRDAKTTEHGVRACFAGNATRCSSSHRPHFWSEREAKSCRGGIKN